MRITTIAAAIALSAMGATALQAHHGWSSYDATKTMTIKGKILKSAFEQPHASIVIAHEGKDWTIILAPTSRMIARGATEDKVTVGQEISATGYPLKSGEPEMRAEFVTIDGKDIQLR